MSMIKAFGVLSFAALAVCASGCVSTYDAGVQTAVSRPTYGPAQPMRPRPTTYNPTPVPRPDPNNHHYSYKPNANSTAYSYYPGTQNRVTTVHTTAPVYTTTVHPATAPQQQTVQKAVNPNGVYTAPVLNGTSQATGTTVSRPSNPQTAGTTVSRPSNPQTADTTVSRPSNPQTAGASCQTNADCAANDRCVRTGTTGHCVRQK